jgi:uncharacterized membrane protein
MIDQRKWRGSIMQTTKKLTKRTISVLMSIVMVLTALPLSTTAHVSVGSHDVESRSVHGLSGMQTGAVMFVPASVCTSQNVGPPLWVTWSSQFSMQQ